MTPRQCLLLMSYANEHGHISKGTYWGFQGDFARGRRRVGFQFVTTCFLVWSITIAGFQLSNLPIRPLVLSASWMQILAWGMIPPYVISKLLYADLNGSREWSHSTWEAMPEDEKNLWAWCAFAYMLACCGIFLTSFFWSLLPIH